MPSPVPKFKSQELAGRAVDLRALEEESLIDAEVAFNEFNAKLQSLCIQATDLKTIGIAKLKVSDPLDWFIQSHYLFKSNSLFHRHYDQWRMQKIRKVLEVFPGEFEGLKILELGGGLGDIGAFFASLGAEVLSLEGRRINQRFASIKHRKVPGFKSVICNLEEDFTQFGKFDLILNFGLMEVIRHIDNVMHCCSEMSDRVFVETMVMDSSDPEMILYVKMDPSLDDNPMSGFSSRPSPFMIEKFFEDRGFRTQRLFDSDLNTDYGTSHIYDWTHKNDDEVLDKYRRFWYFTR